MNENPYSPPDHENEKSQPHLTPQAWLQQFRMTAAVLLVGVSGLLFLVVLLMLLG